MAEDTKKVLTFEDVANSVKDNVDSDRKRLLEVVDAMENLIENDSNAALVMIEQMVKAHDVLNRMTQQTANLAAMLLKDKMRVLPDDENDSVFKDIGDDAFAVKHEEN